MVHTSSSCLLLLLLLPDAMARLKPNTVSSECCGSQVGMPDMVVQLLLLHGLLCCNWAPLTRTLLQAPDVPGHA